MNEEVKTEQINSEVEEANVVPKSQQGPKDYEGLDEESKKAIDSMEAQRKENRATKEPDWSEVESSEYEAPVEKKPRELFYERVRTNFPEGKYDEDEDEYFRNAMQMFDDCDNAMNVVRENNEKLFKRLESDPSAAAALAEFIDGVPLPVALRRYFTDEELSAQEGDDYFESYKKAGEERDAHKKEVNDYIEKIKANSTESEKNFKEYAEESRLTPEESDKMWKYYQNLMNEMSSGMISKDFLSLMHKGRNYNQDVEDANEAGKAAGRNEKIVEKLSKPKGDGLPEPTGGKAGVEPKEKRPLSPEVEMFKHIAEKASNSRWN